MSVVRFAIEKKLSTFVVPYRARFRQKVKVGFCIYHEKLTWTFWLLATNFTAENVHNLVSFKRTLQTKQAIGLAESVTSI